jgi:hypothetical protein
MYDALVIQACTLYAPAQFSVGTIATTLNNADHTMPSGRTLIAQDIRRIAQNAQLYAGYVLSNGVLIKGLHQPIIDDDLCQRVRAAPSRRSIAEDRRYVCTKDTTVPLAGLMHCDICQAKMHYTVDKRPNSPSAAFAAKPRWMAAKTPVAHDRLWPRQSRRRYLL